jgi:peptidoglycan/xylan/chitin deacetylase (PgdA/CDA1 family)
LRQDRCNLFVKPEELRKHIRKLRAWGYRFAAFSEFASRVLGEGGENLVALTFDDAPVDNVTTLLPLLLAENVRATVFAVPGWLGDPHPDAPWTRIVTADELRELAASGIEIGAHSMTHRDLSTLTYDEARADLWESRQILEETLQAPVTVAAYPYGSASVETRRACREAGFAFACRSKGLGRWSDPYDLPRHAMGNGSTVLSLRLKRNPRYHRLMESTPMTAGRGVFRRWLHVRDLLRNRLA